MAKRRPKARKRRRPQGRLRGGLKLPTLDQGQWDLVGLGLVSFAAFFACVFYLGWAGGEVGEVLADGMLVLFGGAGYLAPVAFFAAGAVVMLRPMLPAVQPWGIGALCLGAALTLGLAAGSLGLGPGDTARDGFLDAEYLRHHGGLVGESLFWVSSHLFSHAGSHILFVFLLLAGVLLLTGASVAGIVSATRQGVATTTERVRVSKQDLANALSGLTTAPPPQPRGEAVSPPEPEDSEPVVRATHVEAPALDGSERYPDLYEEDDEEYEEPVEEPMLEPEPVLEPPPLPDPTVAEVAAEAGEEVPALTPQGNRRSAVTESDEIDYRMPKPSFLKRSNGAQKVDTKGIARTGGEILGEEADIVDGALDRLKRTDVGRADRGAQHLRAARPNQRAPRGAGNPVGLAGGEAAGEELRPALAVADAEPDFAGRGESDALARGRLRRDRRRRGGRGIRRRRGLGDLDGGGLVLERAAPQKIADDQHRREHRGDDDERARRNPRGIGRLVIFGRGRPPARAADPLAQLACDLGAVEPDRIGIIAREADRIGRGRQRVPFLALDILEVADRDSGAVGDVVEAHALRLAREAEPLADREYLELGLLVLHHLAFSLPSPLHISADPIDAPLSTDGPDRVPTSLKPSTRRFSRPIWRARRGNFRADP